MKTSVLAPIFLLLALTCCTAVNAIKCYECHDCHDPFDADAKANKIVNCTGSGKDGVAVCVKSTGHLSSGGTSTSRGCDTDRGSDVGCAWCDSDYGVTSAMCTCTSDLCNTATSTVRSLNSVEFCLATALAVAAVIFNMQRP